jgi:hypothetical protein
MEQFRDRVKEVAIIVTAVREGATVSMINGKQCESLASVYKGIDDYLKKLVETDAAKDIRTLPLLDEIIRVLERGKVLVLQYGSAQWFELAVTTGDNREAFKEIHLLLETNIKTLQNHISQSSPDLYVLSNLSNYIFYAKERMGANAEDDHDKILETLQMFYKSLPSGNLRPSAETSHSKVLLFFDPPFINLITQLLHKKTSNFFGFVDLFSRNIFNRGLDKGCNRIWHLLVTDRVY